MESTKESKNKFTYFVKKYWLVLFFAVVIVAVFFRFFNITKSAIWHDEGFTAMLSSRNWLDIWTSAGRDVHPPLYYLMLHTWSLVFGKSALALRSMSAISGVIIVMLGYLITYKISNRKTLATLAAILLALNPFLIRYSQEARMYGVLGVFLLIAMLGLILMVQKQNSRSAYVLYIAGVSLGLYTHYFTFLAVIAFWVYVVWLMLRNKKTRIHLLLNKNWWIANILAILIFVPWIPSMYAQFKRAQGLSWLSKTGFKTLNDTVWQFFTFTDAHRLWQAVYWIVPIFVLGLIIYSVVKDKSKEKFTVLLVLFSFLPLLLAILVSLNKPIFHERYFAFSAIGICILLAFSIANLYNRKKYIAVSIFMAIVALQFVGIRNVYSQASHRMDTVMKKVNSEYKNGDLIISGELYTFFDSSYYNKTGQKIYLYTGNAKPNGYGESGLIYNKNLYVSSLNNLSAQRIWVVGKTGKKDYFTNIPYGWTLQETISDGYSEARLYQIQYTMQTI